MKEAEKKTDRSHIIKELEDRLVKKWKADKLSSNLLLPGEKPAYLKTNKKIDKR
ncbi:MAG TPA: hypothetical protein VJU78_10990 [Chitinophagaceae bacterium]|nr:hypothetical protein [Chitinophagaceae bacterium]